MNKTQYEIEYDLLTEWYNSGVAKLDYVLAQMRIELMKKYKLYHTKKIGNYNITYIIIS